MRSEHETAQTPDVTFLKDRTAGLRHSYIVGIHCYSPFACFFLLAGGSQLWLVSAGQRCCRRPGWGRGDVVHRATAGNLVRRGQAGARPVLRCRRPPLVTVSSSCCAGRSGSLPGKPLTGGTGAATEATAAGPHTGAGATGTSPLSEGHSTQDKSRCQALLQAPSDTSPAAAAH